MPPSVGNDSILTLSTPLEIITRGKWDQVLFTTYALSLSFYETQLHKLGLARNGCRDIRIVSDADGYQMSLCERQSHRVGNEYRLTPAAMPKGVFHPKITWLGGRQFDVILLGSGNLTFGGFGKNLECLEVIRSDKDPAFFGQIARMLAEWEQRPDLRFTEMDWLPIWRERGEAISRTATGMTGTGPLLLHSTVTSVGNQLAALIRPLKKVVEIRSLSPFYDPDADGILKFAEQVGADRLSIGIPTGREASTTFPFGKSRVSSVHLSALRFNTSFPDQQQNSHAKILEIHLEDGSGLIITGSVNATRKSLLTADNIETAIVRRLPRMEDSPFRWEPAPLPSVYNTLRFKNAGLGQRVIVDARISSDGHLTGSLLTAFDPSGTWQAMLQRSDGNFKEFEISVNLEGRFTTLLPDPGLFEFSNGLQLTISFGEHSGTGWVAVEELLIASRRNFLSPAVLFKLLGSEADEADEAELLRYLATSAQRHLLAFATEITSFRQPRKAAAGEEEPTWQTVPVSLLNPNNRAANSSSSHSRQDPQDAVLDGLMRRIRTNLMTQKWKEIPSYDVDGTDDEKGAAREQKERERNRKKLVESLADFHVHMITLVRSSDPGPARSAALCMWLEVAFPILHRRLEERDTAARFLMQWCHAVLPSQLLSNSTPVLAIHVLGTLLTLACLEITRQTDPGARHRILGEIHEMLDCFCDCQPLLQAVHHSGILHPAQTPLATGLLVAPDLQGTLAKVGSILTPRQQLEALKALGTPAEANFFPILGLPIGDEINRRLSSPKGLLFHQLSASAKACPSCFETLTRSTQLKIKSNRVGSCDRCNEILLLIL